MASLKLDEDWDLTLDGANDLALCEGSEELSQNVAAAVRVWRGEAWYDINFGVPYTSILANLPPQSLVGARISQTAFAVDGVESIEVNLEPYNKTRVLRGNILINGVTNAAL